MWRTTDGRTDGSTLVRSRKRNKSSHDKTVRSLPDTCAARDFFLLLRWEEGRWIMFFKGEKGKLCSERSKPSNRSARGREGEFSLLFPPIQQPRGRGGGEEEEQFFYARR